MLEQLREYIGPTWDERVDLDLGHGRIECRRIGRSGDIPYCPLWLDLPEGRFVARVARFKRAVKRHKTETVDLVPNLPPEQGNCERLLAVNRAYWEVKTGCIPRGKWRRVKAPREFAKVRCRG